MNHAPTGQWRHVAPRDLLYLDEGALYYVIRVSSAHSDRVLSDESCDILLLGPLTGENTGAFRTLIAAGGPPHTVTSVEQLLNLRHDDVCDCDHAADCVNAPNPSRLNLCGLFMENSDPIHFSTYFEYDEREIAHILAQSGRGLSNQIVITSLSPRGHMEVRTTFIV